MAISDAGGDNWLCTVVYINSQDVFKQQCLSKIKCMAGTITDPWVILGDFNEIASQKEVLRLTLGDISSSNSGWMHAALWTLTQWAQKNTWRAQN